MPQTDEREVFILDQDGNYTGSYGGKNGKTGIFFSRALIGIVIRVLSLP